MFEPPPPHASVGPGCGLPLCSYSGSAPRPGRPREPRLYTLPGPALPTASFEPPLSPRVGNSGRLAWGERWEWAPRACCLVRKVGPWAPGVWGMVVAPCGLPTPWWDKAQTRWCSRKVENGDLTEQTVCLLYISEIKIRCSREGRALAVLRGPS